MTANLSFSSQ